MRCSTCGELLQPGAVRCPTCGAATPIGLAVARPLGLRRCPRCAYQGEGIPYFRRAGHLGLLMGVGVFTYGFGGLIYWLARRKHLICPRCGLGWEHAGRPMALTEVTPGASPGASPRIIDAEPDEPLPSSGIKRRALGTLLVLLGAFLVLLGFVEPEVGAVVAGSLVGTAGSLTFYWGWQGLQERRKAMMGGLQRKILRLASAKGGTLTVTQVAADLNLSIPAAEKILMSMDDGFRVRSEISNEGVIYYEFPELLHRRELGPGD